MQRRRAVTRTRRGGETAWRSRTPHSRRVSQVEGGGARAVGRPHEQRGGPSGENTRGPAAVVGNSDRISRCPNLRCWERETLRTHARDRAGWLAVARAHSHAREHAIGAREARVSGRDGEKTRETRTRRRRDTRRKQRFRWRREKYKQWNTHGFPVQGVCRRARRTREELRGVEKKKWTACGRRRRRVRVLCVVAARLLTDSAAVHEETRGGERNDDYDVAGRSEWTAGGERATGIVGKMEGEREMSNEKRGRGGTSSAVATGTYDQRAPTAMRRTTLARPWHHHHHDYNGRDEHAASWSVKGRAVLHPSLTGSCCCWSYQCSRARRLETVAMFGSQMARQVIVYVVRLEIGTHLKYPFRRHINTSLRRSLN